MSEKHSNRVKHGTATERLHLRLTTADVSAISNLEATATKFANVTGAAVVRRAIHFYQAHLHRLTPEKQEREVREMQRGTYAA